MGLSTTFFLPVCVVLAGFDRIFGFTFGCLYIYSVFDHVLSLESCHVLLVLRMLGDVCVLLV